MYFSFVKKVFFIFVVLFPFCSLAEVDEEIKYDEKLFHSWIVDFKTSEHLEADLDSFLDIQEERYSPQLNRYAQVFNAIDSRPTKLGLYFPLHDAWREWVFDETSVE